MNDSGGGGEGGAVTESLEDGGHDRTAGAFEEGKMGGCEEHALDALKGAAAVRVYSNWYRGREGAKGPVDGRELRGVVVSYGDCPGGGWKRVFVAGNIANQDDEGRAGWFCSVRVCRAVRAEGDHGVGRGRIAEAPDGVGQRSKGDCRVGESGVVRREWSDIELGGWVSIGGGGRVREEQEAGVAQAAQHAD